MKRLLFLLLTALLLTGCGTEQPPETTETTAAETEPAGLYIPESIAQQQTGGAVRVYALEPNTCHGLYSMGTHLLIAADGELITLTGDTGVPSAERTTGADTPVSCIDAAVTGVGYYLPYTREVEILNPQLQENIKLKLPEDMVGEPVISMAQNQIFYTTETEIRAIDIKTGISRLIRKQSAANQMQLESHFDGTVLACRFTDEAGQSCTEYISSQTGRSLSEDSSVRALRSFGEQYFAWRTDGTEEQLVFGAQEGMAQIIRLPEIAEASLSGQEPMLAMNGVLSYGKTDSGLILSFFDLRTGKRIAQTMLSGLQTPTAFHCDGTFIWFLAAQKENEQQMLYRWDITGSAVQDANVYTEPLYTAENPDTQGLAACREQADQLESRYGVKIAIWKDAEMSAGEYAVVPEHNPRIISAMLADLEGALEQFPDGFLEDTVAGGEIWISLVRSIEEQDAAQFWDGGDSFTLLSSETETARWFYQMVAYAIDSHVLGNSRDFDTWSQLNPEGFEYTYSFEVPEKSPYLEGTDRAFTDLHAMSYPHEDRCRLFAYAMLPDCAEMFASAAMQAKLQRLCMGIREAYGLEKSPESYPWEHYLEASIAFTEE